MSSLINLFECQLIKRAMKLCHSWQSNIEDIYDDKLCVGCRASKGQDSSIQDPRHCFGKLQTLFGKLQKYEKNTIIYTMWVLSSNFHQTLNVLELQEEHRMCFKIKFTCVSFPKTTSFLISPLLTFWSSKYKKHYNLTLSRLL